MTKKIIDKSVMYFYKKIADELSPFKGEEVETTMKKIRPTAAAGRFYTNNKLELSAQLDSFFKNATAECDYKSRAIIVPHAGYEYSGQLAAQGFEYLNTNVKNLFIIGPPHYVPVKNVALSSCELWDTPLGEISVNQVINQELVEKFGCEFEDSAFADEHSLEVQIPFILKKFKNVKIIPILANNFEKVEKIIKYYWENPENGFIISSDLSHFYTSAEAKKIDTITAEMIELKQVEEFNHQQACGAVGILALTNFAKFKNFSLIRVGMVNSGDVTGDNSRVVGYGSWFLYEGEKNEFIKKYYSDYVIEVCKTSILAGLNNDSAPKINQQPAVFNELGACFVTLEKKGDLRGCIGSIIAHRTLINDLVQNAKNSAFSDPRFHPLKEEEFEELSIDVSLLSAPEKMKFKDEADLLEQIRPFIDGIIIKDGAYQSVYLPSVWEQLPDKKLFLESLKIKAGMHPKHFSNTFEALRFSTEYIKSN